MDKKEIRDGLRFAGAILCIPLYIPHIMVYSCGGGENLIYSRMLNE